MKKILGLDLGTNSIGWAVVNGEETENNELKLQKIEASGSRIIPMDASVLGDFDKGNSISQTADRTKYRGTRRLRERCLLRRERLHRVLQILNFLPNHYANELDKYGKIIKNKEPKLAWFKDQNNHYKFLFEESFNEMIADFKQNQPQLITDGKKIPYDWTIYYLRKKALSKPISKEELAWLLLNFNQKRGYYQLRGEEEEDNLKQKVEFYSLEVIEVEDSGDKKGKDTWYNVKLENGWVYRRASSIPLDWVGKTKDFIVTTSLNEDGSIKTDKDGKEIRSFRAPKEEDWTLLKKKTENSIIESGKSVGCYIYDSLLANPNQKIIGKLVRTIERKFYKEEIRAIVKKQIEYIPELQNKDLYEACIQELYSSNEAYRNSIANRDFSYLLIDDILFYQRPLKSKKSTISNCPYEIRYDNEGKSYPIKCAAKSNPFFQEFRLWQFISNLRIYQREKMVDGKLITDVDVTNELLKTEDAYADLFKWLNDRTTIKQDTLLSSYFKIKKVNKSDDTLPYRWNYVEDKEYPCNKTRAAILAKLQKTEKDLLSKDLEYKIWHLLYSVSTKAEIDSVFETTKKGKTNKHTHKNDPITITDGIYKTLLDKNFSEETIEKLKNVKFEEKDYASYSEKALKKILPLMRLGEYWSENNIDSNTLDRIDKIITGEYDEKIRSRVRDKAFHLSKIDAFRGLPVWLACYIVYDRHSESSDVQKWDKPECIDEWLKDFKQHSLRNPIVEQIITETMRTVRDIWKQVGQIDEIHVELGREMKNPADKRKLMTESIQKNENTNLRIKAMLAEFINPEYNIENVRPYSPSQQDILRIYEDGALQELTENDKEYDFISKISNTSQPSKSDIIRYKCWLEQKYCSPYTGEVISLSRLFTEDYEIEHIIPQSRYFDDSFSNKVICESEVNKLKSNMLGFEFIKEHQGQVVTLTGGKKVTIFKPEEYQVFISTHYLKNRTKMKKLLMDEIPDGFIERQMNDSRYISKYIKGILSNIVRVKDENGDWEQESVSKNLISCNGNITDYLKKDWGINDIWNKIILPRFYRMNELTGKKCFISQNKEGHDIPDMPIELQKGFNKKRIDHRHHAMDAIVIACTTRDHVNLLNNEAAMSKNKQNRYALSNKLRRIEKKVIGGKEQNVFKEFIKPWDTFCLDVENSLNAIIVSFKQNLRVINKTNNQYEHYVDGKKEIIKQQKGESWSIRKSLHKETVFGEVNLRFVKDVSIKEALKQPNRIVNKDVKQKIKELVNSGYDAKSIEKYFKENKDVWSELSSGKLSIYYFTKETKDRYFATRKLVDTSFNKKKIEEEVTDTGIKKILLAHLEANDNNAEVAFSPDGIDKMNRNIIELNHGHFHQPINKVRLYEKAEKFAVGTYNNKSKKFVEAAKGTNLFFAVYESIKEEENKKRSFVTIPLNLIIDCQKHYKKQWRDNIDSILKEKELISDDNNLLFILSPNDLVYLPTFEELKNGVYRVDKERIYKMVSSSGKQCFFIKENVASLIVDKEEFSSLNKMERAITGEMIKDMCIPLTLDRLGNIIAINDKPISNRDMFSI